MRTSQKRFGFMSSPFIRKPIHIIQNPTKNIKLLITLYLLSYRSCVIRAINDTFVELLKHRVVEVQPLQNPPLCSTTDFTFLR
jgi:hypothetical protein